MHEQWLVAQGCPYGIVAGTATERMRYDQYKACQRRRDGSMHRSSQSEGGVGADVPTRTRVPRRHCRVCHRVDSGAHLTDARHPSQTMAIHPNRDIRGHQGAEARHHAARPSKREQAGCATFLGEPPVTSEEASSAMGMWGLLGGSCAPAGFPVTRCVGCFLHATDATTPNWPLPSLRRGDSWADERT